MAELISENTQTPTTLDSAKSSATQNPFKQEVDGVVTHIEAEMEKAKEAGKPPLIILMEEHYDRDALARELALLPRLKEKGITHVQLETREVQSTEIARAAGVHQATVEILRRIPAGIDEQDRKEVEDISSNIDRFAKSTTNEDMLSGVARSMGMSVGFTQYPPDAPLATETKKMGVLDFVRNMRAVDGHLIQGVQNNEHIPTILITGGLHGKAIKDEMEADYHVIPINLHRLSPAELENMVNTSEMAKNLRKIESQGITLKPTHLAVIDMSDRENFVQNVAFQANQQMGLTTIREAVEAADSLSPTGQQAGIPQYWRELDDPLRPNEKGAKGNPPAGKSPQNKNSKVFHDYKYNDSTDIDYGANQPASGNRMSEILREAASAVDVAAVHFHQVEPADLDTNKVAIVLNKTGNSNQVG